MGFRGKRGMKGGGILSGTTRFMRFWGDSGGGGGIRVSGNRVSVVPHHHHQAKPHGYGDIFG